jgi:transketolase
MYTNTVHGSPLGDEDLSNIKKKFGFSDKKFEILPAVSSHYNRHKSRGQGLLKAWEGMFVKYAAQFPAEGAELARRLKGTLPTGWYTHTHTHTHIQLHIHIHTGPTSCPRTRTRTRGTPRASCRASA